MITTIPFSGFYESWHSQEIDRELENLVSDSSGCHPISDVLAEKIWDGIDWRKAMDAYAKEYAESFAHLLNNHYGILLRYESMSSPREYNFTTDRIFCTISKRNARKLYKAVSRELLDKAAKDRFTSYDGFISSYSPSVEDWGKVETWDHNQLGTLVIAAAVQFLDEDWESSIIENMSCNGDVSEVVWKGLNEKGKRVADIAYYLRKRQERAYRKSA